MIYSVRDCNVPSKSFGYWWLSQFRRWGMVQGAPNYQQVVDRVIRRDIYLEAMKEIGVSVKAPDMQPIKLFNGTFDPKEPEKYARSFAVNSVTG
jgi:nitrate/nitrite transport system substrate-binding protein